MSPKSKSPQRAVIVLRASLNAEDRTTLITQESEARDYCDRKGIAVVAVFTDDGRSGYKAGTPRPGRDAAMAMIQRGQADLLIVWKLDRLVRNLVEFVSLWDRIQKAGAQFVSVVEQFDTTTTMGKLMLIIVAAFAEMESEMKRDRALPFHKYRAEQGLAPGGPRPFGYDRVDGSLLVNEVESDALRSMAQMVLDGASLSEVVRSLNVLGSRDIPVTMRGAKRMLTSPTVAGLRIHDGKEYPGCWDAILDHDTWDKVCTVLGDPNRRTNFSDGKPAYLLTGIMRCGTCGGTMLRKQHPAGMRYKCKGCSNGIPMAVADEAVTAFLLDAISPEAWQALKEQGTGYDPAVIAALEAELDMMDEMKASGELSPERYRKQNAAILARMAAATNAEPLDLPEIADLQSGWDSLSLEDQRAVISTLLESIKLTAYDYTTRLSFERIEIQRAC